jgi:hypothetical protein
MVPVDPVSLNHQKLAATDWSTGEGRALFSSGNLTKSCLDPHGDLAELPADKIPEFSKPNANNVITVDSPLAASVVHNQLAKTLDPDFLLRGKEFPYSGAFKLEGPPKASGEVPALYIAFTPGGALGNIGKNFLARMLRETPGPLHISEFSISSKEVSDGIFVHAQNEIKEGRKFEFTGVGDRLFVIQDYSVFLEMSGYKLDRAHPEDGYTFDPENRWLKLLGKEDFSKLQERIRIAPEPYTSHGFKLAGVSYEANAKAHHKLMVVGDFSTAGSSFNPSHGAESNNEQSIAIKDSDIANESRAIVNYLYDGSTQSVLQEVTLRNGDGKTARNIPACLTIFEATP